MYKDEYDKYFGILELPRGASLEEITKAKKDLIIAWHPDKHINSHDVIKKEAQKKTAEINDAFDKAKYYIENEDDIEERPEYEDDDGEEEWDDTDEDDDEVVKDIFDDIDPPETIINVKSPAKWIFFSVAIIGIFISFRIFAGGNFDISLPSLPDLPGLPEFGSKKSSNDWTGWEEEKRPDYKSGMGEGAEDHKNIQIDTGSIPELEHKPVQKREKQVVVEDFKRAEIHHIEIGQNLEAKFKKKNPTVSEFIKFLTLQEKAYLIKMWFRPYMEEKTISNHDQIFYKLQNDLQLEKLLKQNLILNSPELTSLELLKLKTEYGQYCAKTYRKYDLSQCTALHRQIYLYEIGAIGY